MFVLCCLPGTPLLTQASAQTQIGGGTCSSSNLRGIYSFTITGRQVTSACTFSSVFQGNGSATFDGLSKVTLALTIDTIASVATPMTWGGTYSVQANCAGVITITSGDSGTLNLAVYDQGTDFLVTGNDALYNYSGSGNTQPSGCSASTLSGVYTFTGTGYSLSGGSVAGAEDGAGLLQFDGVSILTVNFNVSTLGKAPSGLTLTGSYSISSICLGSATLTDATKTNNYVLNFSITSSAVASAAFDGALAQSGKFLISGSGHAIYGQPAATAANHRDAQPTAGAFAKLSESVYGWKI